jgi:hypothetical protein
MNTSLINQINLKNIIISAISLGTVYLCNESTILTILGLAVPLCLFLNPHNPEFSIYCILLGVNYFTMPYPALIAAINSFIIGFNLYEFIIAKTNSPCSMMNCPITPNNSPKCIRRCKPDLYQPIPIINNPFAPVNNDLKKTESVNYNNKDLSEEFEKQKTATKKNEPFSACDNFVSCLQPHSTKSSKGIDSYEQRLYEDLYENYDPSLGETMGPF